MKQWPPPNVQGYKNTATHLPPLEPGCCNFILGKQQADKTASHNDATAYTNQHAQPPVYLSGPTPTASAAATPTASSRHVDTPGQYTTGQPATSPADAPHPVRMDASSIGKVPTTEKEAHTMGCKAGAYTGCVECCLFSAVRPSHEFDKQLITDPALQKAHEKGALEGRACACVACLPTFYLCNIM